MFKIKNIFEDFHYVVERPKPAKVCFGSTGVRVTGFMPKHITQVCPASYDLHSYSGTFEILNKVRSRKGVGGLVSDVPRFKQKIRMQIPSPGKYDLRQKYSMKENKHAPFGFNAKRQMKQDKLPGPGTYSPDAKKCRRTLFAYNFGQPTMIPAVNVLCQPWFEYKCDRCSVICTGDYWERNHTNYLCHICWADERYAHEMYSQQELKQFKKIRTCEFKHNHNGTTAAVKLFPDLTIKRMERLENYLDLFISC